MAGESVLHQNHLIPSTMHSASMHSASMHTASNEKMVVEKTGNVATPETHIKYAATVMG